MTARPSERAVVIGAGIAGLCAAMALSDDPDRTVVLVERDADVPAAAPRPGVPQGRLPHLLLAGGFTALTRLFPAIEADLIAAGGVPYRTGADLLMEVPGLGALPRRDLPFRSVLLQRAPLEAVVARRVAARPNVLLRTGSRVAGIVTNAGRVIGVDTAGPDRATGFEPADLVIDASGQGQLAFACATEWGAPPRATMVGVGLGYASVDVAIPSQDAPDCAAMITMAAPPDNTRTGYMLRIDETSWKVLLVGRGEDMPPADAGAMRAWAERLTSRTIFDALAHAEPSGPTDRFRFNASIRRHYAADAMPAGLLPFGDALCRFNPVYGQGMSIAAMEGELLRDLIAGGADLAEVAEPFLAGAAPIIDRAWSASVVPDFAYPSTCGDAPADIGVQLEAQGDLMRRAFDDAAAHRALIEALHLVTPEPAYEPAPRFLRRPAELGA